MAEQELDANQPATPYKLEKARERGQVARSADVVSAVVFVAAVTFLVSQGSRTWHAQLRLDHALLAQAGRIDASPAALWSLVERMVGETISQAAPFLLTLLVAAVVGNLAQAGPVFSVTPLKPDWNRVNPAAGFKRVFSLRTLFVGLRALLKLAALATVVWFSLRSLAPRLFALASASPRSTLEGLLDAMGALGLRLALALGVIAVLDLAFTRREFAKQMRMSRREQKEELRNREGDPRIRARMRELRRELRKRALALRNVAKADVLVTNPTRLAVALRYEHGAMAAPQVVAKGAGRLAAAMRRIASRHGVPIVENRSVARALFREVPVDGAVPAAHFAAVARIVVWVLAMRRPQAERGGDPRGRGKEAGWAS